MLIKNDRLWDILQSDENDQLDFKSSELLTNPDGENRYKIAKHIIGFANHRGGKLVFGVDDNKEPEGIDLNEEECLHTISDIISSNCSPVVNYSYSFYSDRNGDLSNGSVLILNIAQRGSTSPVAIVENSNGNIRKREYRIRSGESTRLVPDGELSYLFSKIPELEFEQGTQIKYTHLADLTPSELTLRPPYFFDLNYHYQRVADSNAPVHDEIDSDDESSQFITYLKLLQSIVVCDILSVLFTSNNDYILEEINEKMEDDNIVSGYEFLIKSEDQLLHTINGNHILSKLPFELTDFLVGEKDRTYLPNQREIGFLLPENGSISLSDDAESIRIAVDTEFEMNIETSLIMVKTGLPEDYPFVEDYPYHHSDDPKHITAAIKISTSFQSNYPTQSFDNYSVSKYYYNIISERILNRYNWDSFIEDTPDRELFMILNQLDDIEGKIDELPDN